MQELQDIYKSVLLVKSTFEFIYDITSSIYSSINLVGCGIANGMIKSGIVNDHSIDKSIITEEEGILEKQMETSFPSRMQKLKEDYKTLVREKEEELNSYFEESHSLDVKQSILKFDIFDRDMQEQLVIKYASEAEKSPNSLLYNIEMLKIYVKVTTGFCLARVYELSESLGFLIGKTCYAIREHSPEIFQKSILKLLDPVEIGKIYIAASYFINSFIGECLSALKSASTEFISASFIGFTDGILEARQEYIKDHLDISEKLKKIESDLDIASIKITEINFKKDFLISLKDDLKKAQDATSLLNEQKELYKEKQKELFSIPKEELSAEQTQALKQTSLKLSVIEELEKRKLLSGNLSEEIDGLQNKFSYDLHDACEVKNKELSLLKKAALNNSDILQKVLQGQEELAKSQQELGTITKYTKHLPQMVENYKSAYVNYLSGVKSKMTQYKESSSPLTKLVEQSPANAVHISSLSIRCLVDQEVKDPNQLKTSNYKSDELYEKAGPFFSVLDQVRAHSYALSATMSFYLYSTFQALGKATYNLLKSNNIPTENQERQK